MKITHTGVSALARETGYSIASVSKKLSLGKSPDQIRAQATKAGIKPVMVTKSVNAAGTGVRTGAGPVVDHLAKSKSAVATAATTRQNSGDDGGDETYYKAKGRKETALANMHELKYQEAVGDLLPVGMLNAWFSGCIIKCRDILLGIGPELRDRLAQETDPVRCEDLVMYEIRRALVELSEYGGNTTNPNFQFVTKETARPHV